MILGQVFNDERQTFVARAKDGSLCRYFANRQNAQLLQDTFHQVGSTQNARVQTGDAVWYAHKKGHIINATITAIVSGYDAHTSRTGGPIVTDDYQLQDVVNGTTYDTIRRRFILKQNDTYEPYKNSRPPSKKSKKRQKHRRSRHKIQNQGTLSTLYSDLININLDRCKFISFPLGIQYGIQISQHQNDPSSNIAWKKIRCTHTVRIDNLTLKTTCGDPNDVMRSSKVFIRQYKNLHEFARDVQNGTVKSKTVHKLTQYLAYTEENLNATVINHNRELNRLHFKFQSNNVEDIEP